MLSSNDIDSLIELGYPQTQDQASYYETEELPALLDSIRTEMDVRATGVPLPSGPWPSDPSDLFLNLSDEELANVAGIITQEIVSRAALEAESESDTQDAAPPSSGP